MPQQLHRIHKDLLMQRKGFAVVASTLASVKALTHRNGPVVI